MANVRFTEFPSSATLGGTDIIPIVQDGGNRKITGAVLATYIGTQFVGLTGNQTVAGVKTFSSQLISTVAIGTAPFSVISTTKVTNLNADLLDGLSSADFASAASLSSYLPLAGGTLTGALNGTSAVFSSSVTAGSLISTKNNAAYDSAFIEGANGIAYLGALGTASDIQLYNGGSTKLTIKPISGNVGIGTTSPSEKLSVNGEVSAVTRFRLNPTTQTNQIIGDGTASNLAGANNLLLRNDSGSIFFASGSANVQMLLNTSGNLLINTSTDIASSKLTIDSTTQGVLVPRMTTTQINAISSPANGLIVYNTTLAVLCFYDGTGWKRVVHLAM